MGKGTLILLVTSIAVAILASLIVKSMFADRELPENIIDPNLHWGAGSGSQEKEDKSIKPFKIAISDSVIQDLKSKLSQEIKAINRLPPPLEGIGFEYGFNSHYLKTVTSYWLEKYDWKVREKLLNTYPHFTTKIAGINIHFQHVKGQNNGKYKKTLPLLLLHGWPGSFIEFQKMIPLLVEPKNSDVNFELVIPSIPGYGFSEASVRPGLGALETAQIFLKLMQRLGHERFYVQGGDWGSLIAADLATVYPKNVIGVHSNACMSMHPLTNMKLFLAANFPSWFLTAEEAERFIPYSKFFTFMIRETGYMHIQATKPDTVGVGLTHSPSGLAAYILEKFSTWTKEDGLEKKDGALTAKFTMDELLDNIMLYWVSNSITTSMRFYAENLSKRQFGYNLDPIPIKVPAGCVVGRNEPYVGQTENMVKDKFHSLVSFNYLNDGGHFLAYELPKELTNDVFSFVQKVENLKKN